MNSDFVDYVVSNFSQSEVVLEFGAGLGSTKTFSEYFSKVYSVENNKKYCDLYNSNYLHVPLDANGWYNNQELEKVLPTDYSLLILDGPLGGYDSPFVKDQFKVFRSGFFRVSWDLIKKDVVIIVDDTDRDWHERDVVSFLSDSGYQCVKHKTFFVCTPK